MDRQEELQQARNQLYKTYLEQHATYESIRRLRRLLELRGADTAINLLEQQHQEVSAIDQANSVLLMNSIATMAKDMEAAFPALRAQEADFAAAMGESVDKLFSHEALAYYALRTIDHDQLRRLLLVEWDFDRDLPKGWAEAV